jgi:hypothetical protein
VVRPRQQAIAVKRRILVRGHDVLGKVFEPLLPVSLVGVVLQVHIGIGLVASAKQVDVPC